MSDDDATPHRRRPRYRGTHPRRFDEKYKEHAPERWPQEFEKAVERGSTPAGSHLPVMAHEVLAALRPAPGETFLDATLGGGGHARLVARAVAPGGRVVALDRDGEELARTAARLAAEGLAVDAHHAPFSAAAQVLRSAGVDAVDGVLADLGCSSMQLDRPERGFAFKHDGPLDLRMDRARGETGAEWLARADEETLRDVLVRHGDEPDAAAIARAIVRARDAGAAPATTSALVAVVLAAKGIPGTRWRRPDPFTPHPAARTFQALRVIVNREHEHLAALLRDLPWLVRPGGRVALLTFHSGEEQAVRSALDSGTAAGLWLPAPAAAPARPARPTRDETRRNPRSRSAKLWSAVRG
mgnify:CR=1 FL=1